jgi:hypothetical protein
MARTFPGVVASLVAMAALTFALSIALWFALGVDGVLQPGSFRDTPLLGAWSVAASAAGAVAGGFLCARLTRSRAAVGALAAIGFLMGAGNAAGQRGKQEPGARPAGLGVFQAIGQRKEPGWFTLLVPVIGAAGILAGGALGRRSSHAG